MVPFAKSVIITSIGKHNLRNDDWSGIVPDIVNVLSQYLNFTYSIAISRDGRFGKYDDGKDEWNGLIKDIIDNVADISVAALSITKSRTQVVDFMTPFETEDVN